MGPLHICLIPDTELNYLTLDQVEPGTLESHVTQVKENIQLKMEKVQQRVNLQEEKYADLTDMPAGIVAENHITLLHI